jgi:hypothetical protein
MGSGRNELSFCTMRVATMRVSENPSALRGVRRRSSYPQCPLTLGSLQREEGPCGLATLRAAFHLAGIVGGAEPCVPLHTRRETVSEPEVTTIDELLEEILHSDGHLPVRTMEAVIARGEEAVAPVLSALEGLLAQLQASDDEERSLVDELDPDLMHVLQMIILLGELRSVAAVPALAEMLRAAEIPTIIHRMAAAEALGKIGAGALPALREVTSDPDIFRRTWGYAALGCMSDEAALELLLDGLERDPEAVDSIAPAIYDHRRPEAIPQLYEALKRAEPWQRLDLEGAIRDLLSEDEEVPLHAMNWRLRYRVEPSLGLIPPSWAVVAEVALEEDLARRREPFPLKSLDEIRVLARADAAADAEAGLCDSCGEPLFEVTGLPVCPDTALEATVMQRRVLGQFSELAESEDLFDVMDLIEITLISLHELQSESRSRKAYWDRDATILELDFALHACRWFVERGVESVSGARASLLAEALRLREKFGDPDGLFSAPGAPGAAGGTAATGASGAIGAHGVHGASGSNGASRAAGLTAGRNEPCPCGSGRKFKKCCGANGHGAGAGRRE